MVGLQAGRHNRESESNGEEHRKSNGNWNYIAGYTDWYFPCN